MRDIISISPRELSKKAMKKSELNINPDDFNSFLNFYTNGRPDTIFVPVIAFLEWKGVFVKCEKHPYALPAKQWTFVYREIASRKYDEDAEMVIKREANNFLLFDAVFLIAYYEDAEDEIKKQILGV